MKQKKASALKKTGGKKKPSAVSQGRQEQQCKLCAHPSRVDIGAALQKARSWK